MELLYTVSITGATGKKSIEVIFGDAMKLDEKIDVLSTSAYKNAYSPIPGTMFGALRANGVDVERLSLHPYLDLRKICNVWLSEEIPGNIKRIGCLEMSSYINCAEDDVLNCIKAYFQMLDIAATSGVSIKTVAMPLLGGGLQMISANLTLVPIVNECISFLKRNASCEKIIFVENNPLKANAFVNTLKTIYSLKEKEKTNNTDQLPLVFISYRSLDKNIADNLCHKLESKGMRVWYAPRDVVGDYASAIVNAIDCCTHFVVIISKNSLESEHVLNEIDLAFGRLSEGIKIKPLRISDVGLSAPFKYYLSRQHWMDAILPPVEEKLDSFVEYVCSDIKQG